jgi:hypothetical protein
LSGSLITAKIVGIDSDGDGYANIEEFLNATDPSVKDVAQPQ